MNYFEIALKSYNGIVLQYNAAIAMNWLNNFAAECAQIIEGMIKGVLQKLPSTPSCLFKTHSLTTLTYELFKTYPYCIKIQDASWLGDFYYNTKYPGAGFIEVSESDAEAIKETTISLAEKLIEIYNSMSTPKTESDGVVNKLKYYHIENSSMPEKFKNAILADIQFIDSKNFPGLLRVILFGSLARSTPSALSDVDLCLVFEDTTDLTSKDMRIFKSELRAASGYSVPTDVVVCTDSQLASDSGLLYREIRRDGIILSE